MTQSLIHNHRPRPRATLRLCVKCGLPMFLSVVEPSDTPGQDRRTFECTKCRHAEIVTITYADS